MKILTTVTVMAVLATALNVQAKEHQQTPEAIQFPELTKSYLKEVQRYELGTIANLEQGLNKDQVRHLFGNPQFNEGIFINQKWNYILDIHVPNTQDYQRCQLRIDFDQHKKIDQWYWKESVCADLAALNQVEAVPAVSSALRSSNLQFAFNRFERSAIVSDSQSIDALIEQIKADQPKHIEIDGYADRIGQSEYNQNLASLRAQTVTQLLIDAGIDANIIDIKAHGSTSAYGQCDGASTAQVVQCLTPNRRVNIYW